jgi:TatA/E family protein of Tat protein translocase
MQIAEIASAEVILIVAVIALLVFGSAKIPKIARGLGSAKSEFEKGVKDSTATDATKKAADKPDATDSTTDTTAG